VRENERRRQREKADRSSGDPTRTAKWLAKDAKRRAAIKQNPKTAMRYRKISRDSKRRQMETPEGRERHRITVRAAVRRLRMLNPNYAAQWERDDKGRWFRAAASADGTITREFLRELEQTQLCPYCCEPIADLEFDHVEPIVRGGAHSAENLAACCAACNNAKGKLRLVEFLIRRAHLSAAA
jgi:5-methylcytosine-specific restriction endonuclease McrA